MNVFPQRFSRVSAFTLFLLFLSAATAFAQVTVITPTRTGTRAALLAPVTVPDALDRQIPPHESKEDLFTRMNGATPVGPSDTAVQTAAMTLPPPNILTGFEGLDINGFLPPDSDGAIGPNHYFEWINIQFAIFDRTGNIVFGPAAGNVMFAGMDGPCETLNDGDPIVLYDQFASRWFVSQFAVSGGANSLCVAISSGDDPTTSTWFLYEYNFGSVFPDYEKYGIFGDTYTLTYHGFLGSFDGVGVGAFDRTAMLASDPTAQLQFYTAEDEIPSVTNYFGILPPRVQGPTNVDADTPIPFIHMASNEGFGGTDRYTILEMDVDFTTPANTTLTRTDLAATAFNQNLCGFARDCIPQPGTTRGLDSFGGNTLFQAPIRDLDPTEDVDLRLLAQGPVDVNGSDLSGIRWIELQNTGAGWSLRQESTFTGPSPQDGRHRWMGSIAMNGLGDIALAYSVSDGTSTFPAIWATGRLAGDPLNMMTLDEVVLREGVASQTHSSSRWGDYAATNVDPTDDRTFWHVNEYITASGTWSTHIAHFELNAASGTRFVSTTGSDTGNNSCTVLPCATVAKAVSEANPGEDIDVAAGTYLEPGLVIMKAVNLIGAGVVIR
ncbi:MAG TPA: hypothetical protein VKP65_16190 [Rhodothermales bacterium]|nr:hypothetical protein [Rhodothermales bacterium]